MNLHNKNRFTLQFYRKKLGNLTNFIPRYLPQNKEKSGSVKWVFLCRYSYTIYGITDFRREKYNSNNYGFCTVFCCCNSRNNKNLSIKGVSYHQCVIGTHDNHWVMLIDQFVLFSLNLIENHFIVFDYFMPS